MRSVERSENSAQADQSQVSVLERILVRVRLLLRKLLLYLRPIVRLDQLEISCGSGR